MDMDAFFAAVEVLRNPELAGKPLVIGGRGDPTRRGVVSTASYEARKFGIHSAMPLRTAYKLCPRAVFLPVDYAEYSRVSRIIKSALREISPVLEDVGIDEAYLDVSPLDVPSEQIASLVKRRIKQATGLTCSVGIAPNKLLAKIASDLRKPDGVTLLTMEDVPSRIWPLAVRKLPWVGPKTEERLKRMGIKTIGEIAAQPLEALIAAFGEAHGSYLHEASRGLDERALVTHWEPKSVSREVTFQQDIGNWQILAKTLAALSREVAESLREDGLLGRSVTVKLRFSDFKTQTRVKTLSGPTDDPATIRHAAFECLGRFEIAQPVRLIGVRVGDLQKR